MVGLRYALLTGRGTTAQVIALRALHRVAPMQEVIIPDILCTTVLDAILLAGLRPVFADVTPRFTLRLPTSESIHHAPGYVLAAHTFGYRAVENHWDSNIVTIEDIVQGIGGQVGQSGKLVFAGFHETKMIPGRGGALLTDDPVLWEAMQTVDLAEQVAPPPDEPFRLAAYRASVAMRRAELLRPFDDHPDNIRLIRAGIAALPAKVRRHNERAGSLREQLREQVRDLPLHLPEVLPGDAIWRYTFAAPDVRQAVRIKRALAAAGVRGSDNYPALSTIFNDTPNPVAAAYTGRLINLYVDETVTTDDLRRAVQVIRGVVTRQSRDA
jgi:dTDP-4-amino-4,6-dideoxygalactose transaminase